MHGIYIDSTQAALNLALEQALFERLAQNTPPPQGYFLLWHNAPSIIVGRHQNTAQEINPHLVQSHALPVIRRITGGGAVYHDLGNLNFSFITPIGSQEKHSFAHFLQPIIDTLRTYGVDAELSGRNDITVGGRKISGSAQLRRGNALLHHGTLLVDLDLDMLGAVLTGSPDKYQSKGIASIRSRVANLSEFLPKHVGMAELKAALIRRCATQTTPPPPGIVEKAHALHAARYNTWQWNYGASPAFTTVKRQRFSWGLVEYCLEIQRGHIACCRIFGDFFAEEDIATLERLLCGLPYRKDALTHALQHIPWQKYFLGSDAVALETFFCQT